MTGTPTGFVQHFRPALATLAAIQFITWWTAFLWPLIVTGKLDTLMLNIALNTFRTVNATQWGPIMAGLASLSCRSWWCICWRNAAVDQESAVDIVRYCAPACAADVILVFDGGHLVEKGSHAELLRRRGLHGDASNASSSPALGSQTRQTWSQPAHRSWIGHFGFKAEGEWRLRRSAPWSQSANVAESAKARYDSGLSSRGRSEVEVIQRRRADVQPMAVFEGRSRT